VENQGNADPALSSQITERETAERPAKSRQLDCGLLRFL
jgi:hypothetical protein